MMKYSKLEEAIADLEGTAVHNCLSGGRSFPSYLEWRLLGPLMMKHEVSIDRYTDSVYIESDYNDKPHKAHVSFAADDLSINEAILLCIIKAQKPK